MKASAQSRPPDAARVARRALALTAVICRSTIEDDGATAEAESLRQSVVAWLSAVGADAEVSDVEWSLLRAPLGTLSLDARLDGSWRSEALVVLGWALGRAELPPHDTQANPFAVARALGFHHPRERTVVAAPWLRPREELDRLARDLGELKDQLRTSGDGAPEGTAAEVQVAGAPLSAAPEAVRLVVGRVVAEREKAASWLVAGEAA